VVLQLLLALLLQELLKQPAVSPAAAAVALETAGGCKLSYTSLFMRLPESSTRCDWRSAGQQPHTAHDDEGRKGELCLLCLLANLVFQPQIMQGEQLSVTMQRQSITDY
jgi:hypothetical protein